jgi:SAM-dependent methyltransferase
VSLQTRWETRAYARGKRYPMRFAVRHPARVAIDVLRRKDSKMAHRWLDGLKGVEIGGASFTNFNLDTRNVDRDPTGFYRRGQDELVGWHIPIDIFASGDALPLEDDAVDFVLASHVIEHMPNPIGALREWRRVARRYVFLLVPHRDRTFDRDRELTPIEELLERDRSGFESDEDKHWSVWNAETFLAMCERAGMPVLEHRDPDDMRGDGFAVVIDARTTLS